MVEDYLALLVLGEHQLLHHPTPTLKRPVEGPCFSWPNEGGNNKGVTGSTPAIVFGPNGGSLSPLSERISPPVRPCGGEGSRPVVIRTSPSESERECGKPDRSYTYISERLRSFLEFDATESSCNSDVASEWKSQEVVCAAAPFKACTSQSWDAGSALSRGQLPSFSDVVDSEAHASGRQFQKENELVDLENVREEAPQYKSGGFTSSDRTDPQHIANEGPLFSHEYCYCQHVGLRNVGSRGQAAEPEVLESGFDDRPTSGRRDDEVSFPFRISHASVKLDTIPQRLEDSVVLASHSGKPRRPHRRMIVVEAPRHLVAAAASVSGKIYRKLSRFSQLPLTAGASSPSPSRPKPHNATAFVVTNTKATLLASTHVQSAEGAPPTTSLVRAAYPKSHTTVTFGGSRGEGASGNGTTQTGPNRRAAGSLVTIPCIQGALGVRQQSGAYVPRPPSVRECQDKQMRMAPQAFSYRRNKPSSLVESCVVISENDGVVLPECRNLGSVTELSRILQSSTDTREHSDSHAQAISISTQALYGCSTQNEVLTNSSASRASCVLSPSRSRLVGNLLGLYSSSASSASTSSHGFSVSPSLKRASRPRLLRSYASSETTASHGTEAFHVLPSHLLNERSHVFGDGGSVCIADDKSSNALGVATSLPTPSIRGFYHHDTTAAVVLPKDGEDGNGVDFYTSLVPLISWEYFSAASPPPTVLTQETVTNASGSARVGHVSGSTGQLSQGKPVGSSIGLGLQVGKEPLQHCRAASFRGLLQYLSVARSIQRIALSFQRIHQNYFDLHHPEGTMAMSNPPFHSGTHTDATILKETSLPPLHSAAPCGRLQCIAACWLEVVSFVNGILELQIKQRRGLRNWSTSSSKVAATSSTATASCEPTDTSGAAKTVSADLDYSQRPSCTTVLPHFKKICSPDTLFFNGANGSFGACAEDVQLTTLATIPSFVAAPSAHWIVFLAFWLERKLHLVHTGISSSVKKTPHQSGSPKTTMACWKPYQLVQDVCCCWPLARAQLSPETADAYTTGIKSSDPQYKKVSYESSLDVCTEKKKKEDTVKHNCDQQPFLPQDYTPDWKWPEKQHSSRWGAQIDIIRRFLILCFCAWSWAEDEATTSGSLAAILQHVWWCTNTQIDLGLSDLATRLRTLHTHPKSTFNSLLTSSSSSSSSSSSFGSFSSQGASGPLAPSFSTGVPLGTQLPDVVSDTAEKDMRSSKSFHWVAPVLTCHKTTTQSITDTMEVEPASNTPLTRARSGQPGDVWTQVLSPHSRMVSLPVRDGGSSTLSSGSKQSPPPSYSTAVVSTSHEKGSFRSNTLTPVAGPLPHTSTRPIACRIRQTLCDAVFRRSRLFAHRKDVVTPDYGPPQKCLHAGTHKQKKTKKEKPRPSFSTAKSPRHGAAFQELPASQPAKLLFPAVSSPFSESGHSVPDYYGEYLALPTCWSADDIEAQTFAILKSLNYKVFPDAEILLSASAAWEKVLQDERCSFSRE